MSMGLFILTVIIVFGFLLVLALPGLIYEATKRDKARKKGQLIVNGQVDATLAEIDRVIDNITNAYGSKRKDMTQDEEFLVEQLRQKRNEM